MQSYNNQKAWLEEFLDDEGVLYNDGESDSSDNGDENYGENIFILGVSRSLNYVT